MSCKGAIGFFSIKGMQQIHLPVVNMREAPHAASKIVSQALFAERIELLEERGEWVLIRTPDRYIGWVQKGSFIMREEPYQGDIEITRLMAHVYATPDTEHGPLLTLPYGSTLKTIDASDSRWIEIALVGSERAFVQKGDVVPQPFDLKQFLGIPYTWGGRSSFGYDCSGFVQMIYRRYGIDLPRDAKDQILDPRLMSGQSDCLHFGDLIFWGKSAIEIKHVAMSLGGLEFIHTSVRENKPYLRISKLSDPEWSGEASCFYPFRTAKTNPHHSARFCSETNVQFQAFA